MFISDRSYRLWEFNVSHKQMLLRSPRGPDVLTNIDVVFWGVEYLEMPSNLNGLELLEESSTARECKWECNTGTKPFTLRSSNNNYVVVAAGCKVLENRLDIFESSLEGFSTSSAQRDRDIGEVLAQL